eukprot:TRINITY_DN290_c0_g1_i3.p1 TRINITY_DN290_c0_g1~~TRINITY_DN290_c0_g1_i3.p1  ORF type:complete len:946 (+),score=350.46 TRINITY_DN290_c0_g1_i3:45-2840(+)
MEDSAPPVSTPPSKPATGAKATIERFSAAVHRYTELFFEKLTTIVVYHPAVTIGLVFLFVVIMAQGVWFYKEELSPDKQFSPRSSQAVKDEDWVLDRFGYENRPVQTMFEAKEGVNMLTKESLLFMMEMHEWLLSQWKIIDGKNVTYEVVCARYTKGDDCKIPVSVLTFWGHNRTRLEADADPLATINTVSWRSLEPSGPPLDFYLGKPEYNAAGDVVSARATLISYNFKNEKVEISGVGEDDPQSRYFEIQIADDSEHRRKADEAAHGVGVYIRTTGQEDVEGSDSVSSDIGNLVMGYILMLIYASFILSRSRPKYSHSLLGIVSVISVGLSTFSAYGFCWYIGIKFNTVVQVLILVLLGVGVDDTFVIMDSWWDCAHIESMRERMIAAVKHAGPAVTITSVTDLIAFLAGSSSSLPALQDFCYYASVGIAFDFMFQVTFVVAVAYLDTVRQQQSRADVLCCIKVGDHTGVCLGSDEEKARWTEAERGLQNRVVGTYLPRLILGSNIGKAVVLVVSAVFLALGIYGCTQLEMNYNNEWFIPSGSPFRDVMRVRDTYFGGNELPANAYFGAIDYPNEQGEVLRASEILRTNYWVVENSTSSWMEDFQQWVQGHPVYGVSWDASKQQIVPAQFYSLLKVFASTATGPRGAWQHIDNIRWNDAGDELKASRVGFRIISKSLTDGQGAIDAMDSLRGALEGVAFPWAFPFVFWESYKVMVSGITRNVAISGSAVFVLVTIMIANIQLGLLVTVAIACVDVCMMGFMPFIGVQLNGVSLICVVMAVGLSVDYSVHIAGAFLTVRCDDNEEHGGRAQRAAYALWKMGPAVVNGGTSTFIAILPAAMAVSYVFKVFFRMFFLIIFFGQWFGVFFLPVVLSFIGPDAYLDAPNLEETPEQNPLHPRHLKYDVSSTPAVVEMQCDPGDSKLSRPRTTWT